MSPRRPRTASALPPKKRPPSRTAPRKGRPPGATRDATRARVLEAARACFARTGYVATTNKDIATAAGVTSAALYQYFDSKTSLYMATVRDAQEELIPHYRKAVAEARSMREAFRALLLASGRLHQRDPSLSAFLSALPVELTRHDEIAAAMAEQPSEVLAIVVDVVEAGARGGEIAASRVDDVVSMFLACTMGLSLYAASIDSAQLRGAIDAFIALMDGTLLRAATEAKSSAEKRGAGRKAGLTQI